MAYENANADCPAALSCIRTQAPDIAKFKACQNAGTKTHKY